MMHGGSSRERLACLHPAAFMRLGAAVVAMSSFSVSVARGAGFAEYPGGDPRLSQPQACASLIGGFADHGLQPPREVEGGLMLPGRLGSEFNAPCCDVQCRWSRRIPATRGLSQRTHSGHTRSCTLLRDLSQAAPAPACPSPSPCICILRLMDAGAVCDPSAFAHLGACSGALSSGSSLRLRGRSPADGARATNSASRSAPARRACLRSMCFWWPYLRT